MNELSILHIGMATSTWRLLSSRGEATFKVWSINVSYSGLRGMLLHIKDSMNKLQTKSKQIPDFFTTLLSRRVKLIV